MTNEVIILNQKQIEQKITRIAYQLWEDNLDEKELVIAGIVDYGYILAERIKNKLEEISGIKITLMKIIMDKSSTFLQAQTGLPVEECADKVVILVDDVVNRGRTMAYGIGIFLDIPVKKLRTVALVDRSHRVFPVSPDYTGLELSTVIKEHVDVVISNQPDTEDVVYLR
ncbi:pyrimidine operon attenuation protein/uracil phosphoribosyltransferase [Arcticibacter pallidicorallinus]|uniref:Pyrimidine operon attenuation protein/uracil phosphoribosyltransferase n=1 Tax=Arcticibacter pallidicorallinus TaxID=1259464 RepID=A0A2T0U931_9SPHI|nr:phosphoribosyltransferase family protein [Arcticibacter pallidicorallinus]PRY54440.1 pyrimidine operon attenuation protein/uracil phosphoribosyltransferase [Arcticibacter pallidicorallinus]